MLNVIYIPVTLCAICMSGVYIPRETIILCLHNITDLSQILDITLCD